MVRNECAGDHGLPGTGRCHENAQFVGAECSKCSHLLIAKLKGRCEFNLIGIRSTLVNHQSTARLSHHLGCLIGESPR